ncbi:unnamed protein product [Caenorhabditis angaria]|uniref:Globin domain-containing protein n=1 Tax=Caenorhabditis angaria TaxID=860376 RepID=A0A9P1IMY5_9PELO|nr:unnamed protein product [Caenorhabditis angaria]
MGNTHPASTSQNPQVTLNSSRVSLKNRKKLGRQRRLSDPSQKMCTLRAASSQPPPSTTPPTIQINGKESFDEIDVSQMRAKSASTDFSNIATTASERRRMFLSSTHNSNARSLDESMSAKMRALMRAKSHSPLKQMRTYSFRSMSSEENLIDRESCSLVLDSWRLVESRATKERENWDFGHFVLQRVFNKMPELARLFGLAENEDLTTIPENHAVRRHAKLFTNVLHLSVKNMDELEMQVAPTVFKYGERHYRPDISPHMTEENVRIFCSQIVCTVFDFLVDSEATPKCAEAWIELLRYLGQKLLDGHEFAKLVAEKKISINRNDHHLFLML